MSEQTEKLLPFAELDCKKCFWQEGGRCYVGTPPRESDGRSEILADGGCKEFENKRRVYDTALYNALTVLASEVEDTAECT